MIAPQPFFRPRGTPFSVLHRIRGLQRLGHTVELVTYPFGESPQLSGLVIHRSARPPAVRDVPIGPSLAKLLLDGPLFFKASGLARSGRFDLIHSHEEAGALGAWLARRTGMPHLYDMHSSLPQQFANFGRFNWRPVVGAFRAFERYVLRGADGVIAICPELRDHVLASGYRGPLALIENCLDFEAPKYTQGDLNQLRRSLDLGGARVVLYTGTLEAYQGLDLLIGAVPEVVKNVPEVRFVLVGGAPRQIEQLRRLAGELGCDSHVQFVPAVEPTEVFLYLKLADVLVTTRERGTNTPLKIYQYLRAGRPIVATDIRSHTQVLSSDSAELVEPRPADIARGLVAVLSDPAKAGRLAESASRLADESYSERIYLERLSAILAELSPNGRRPHVGV